MHYADSSSVSVKHDDSLKDQLTSLTGDTYINFSEDVVIIDTDTVQQKVNPAWNSNQQSSMAQKPRENYLANNFKDLAASSKADYTVDSDNVFTQSEEQALWQHIETMKHQIDGSESHLLKSNSLEINVVIGSTMTLTAGFVSWVLRSGALLTSFLSSMPLLKRFDPLPIVTASKKSAVSDKTDNQKDFDNDLLQDKVEQLFFHSEHNENIDI
jgi:hypothetical protein